MIESALASRLIERGGYVRRARPLVGRYKEWLHFCVARPNLDLLVNFSLSEENYATGLVARMLCAVRTDDWDGDVETVPQNRLELRPGTLHVSFGDNVIRFRNGRFHVRAELERRRLALDLELRPVALPSLVNNIAGGDGTPIHWFLVPRLLATGHVKVGDRVHVLDRALAYHDHNWGGFQWGRDFSWIWGYGHPEQPSNPWSFTFDRFMNRARTTDVARGLLVWKGARQHRLFANAEIELASEGFLRPKRVLKLPRPMALLHAQSATDVPERVFIRARGRGDALDVEIRCREVLQILVPDDHGLGVTAITEVVSEISVDGRIRGEKVVMRGRGVFEFWVGRMSAGDFPSFLKRSIEALDREAPHVYRELCGRLDGLSLRLVVDGAPIWLRADGDRLVTAASGPVQPPAIISSRSCIEALIEARLSLLDALLADDVVMLASTEHLSRLHDAWLLYVAGAVRCRSFPALLDEFLRSPVEANPPLHHVPRAKPRSAMLMNR